MNFTRRDYCQYLLSSQVNYTLTNLADHQQNFSHDTINRFLQQETTSELWLNVQPCIQTNLSAYLIFDDTVLDKRYSYKIEMVRRQYSGNEHRVIRGIGLISCIYVNPDTGLFWLIDYRIYQPDVDGKSKLEHVQEMLIDAITKKQIPFATILMDSWYASQQLMALIDNLGKIYYCPLKKNRLVDDTGGAEKYKQVQALIWSQLDIETGKIIKIKKFPKEKKVKLFRVNISSDKTEYIATNDLNQISTTSVREICKIRWKIEEFHREIKQLTGIDKCQCRKAIIQKNHIDCSLLVWNFLQKVARSLGQTIYQVKTKWAANCFKEELNNPSLIIQLI